MKQYYNIIKNGLGYSFATGFCIGMIPNKVLLKYNNNGNMYSSGINLPIFCGLFCVAGYISSPFLITNYFANNSYFDKLYDKIYDKYDVDIKRYHQYDGFDNKYAYPSVIIISIYKKHNENDKINV